MNRLRILIVAVAVLMSLFGVGRAHAMPLHFAETARDMCTTHHGCDTVPLDCIDHCIASVVDDSVSLLMSGLSVIVVGVVFVFAISTRPVILGFSPIFAIRPPPNRLWVKSTAKRE